ncbi:hypothetical protein HDA40_007940 [Hamadaea flava]|uniref:Uncharacterized protein n=1 Tax=Hamadaea flava TaxID=1742688 RepID=A0ABV8LXN2_9ACTN|nr:hypothetical protein [Hamadaea flava]MCP2329433.1 hypothetical protein [Hamadaea flava]
MTIDDDLDGLSDPPQADGNQIDYGHWADRLEAVNDGESCSEG